MISNYIFIQLNYLTVYLCSILICNNNKFKLYFYKKREEKSLEINKV